MKKSSTNVYMLGKCTKQVIPWKKEKPSGKLLRGPNSDAKVLRKNLNVRRGVFALLFLIISLEYS